MPKRKRDTTIPALVLNVLEPIREVRDTTQAETAAAQQCSETISQKCQHRSPQQLHEDTEMDVGEKGGGVYCVRLPFTNAVLVISLIPHAGQSTAAGVCCNEARGVAFW
jgi:hypothetical protein